MDLKRGCGYKNMMISGMGIFAALVLFSLLFAGEAGALTGCEDLANVHAWNGSISFTYSNTGSVIISETIKEWNFQESGDVRFRLEGNASKVYEGVKGSETGVVNINNMEKSTHESNGVWSSHTVQGSSIDFGNYVFSLLFLDLTTCKYKFGFYPGVNGTSTRATHEGKTYVTNFHGLLSNIGSGSYPITGTILNGNANFPAYSDIPTTSIDYYFANYGGYYNVVMGSAAVTWEFKPANDTSPTPTPIPTPTPTPTVSPTPTPTPTPGSYMCEKPLDALGGKNAPASSRRSGPEIKWNPLYHQYICVVEGGEVPVCGGLTQRNGWPIGPGAPSDDNFVKERCDKVADKDECFESCLMKKFKEERPYYWLISFPGLTNCHKWADETLEECVKECNR